MVPGANDFGQGAPFLSMLIWASVTRNRHFNGWPHGEAAKTLGVPQPLPWPARNRNTECLDAVYGRGEIALRPSFWGRTFPRTPNTSWNALFRLGEVCRIRLLSFARKRYWKIIADNLGKAGWSWGCVSTADSRGRTSLQLLMRIAAKSVSAHELAETIL